MDEGETSKLIERYGAGPTLLRAAWDQCPEDARTWKPSESDWSAHEIVIHCADSEAYAAIRIRLLAAEPDPLIVGYDQDLWARTFTYQTLPVDLAFDVIKAVRASTLHLIQTFDEQSWSAAGRHSESGPYSARDWLAIYAAHLHEHADQIRSNVEQWRERSRDAGEQ